MNADSRRRAPRMALALLALGAAAAAADATPANSSGLEIRYDADTRLVTLKTPFGDPLLGALSDVHPDNFVVYENGSPQPDVNVAIQHTAITFGVLLEHGGRYHALREVVAQHVKDATRALLEQLTPGDTVKIWKYADSAEAVAYESAPTIGLQRQLFELPAPPIAEVDLNDSLIATLQQLRSVSGDKALILISTGINTFSKARFTDTVAEARAAGVPIYVIDIGALVRDDLAPATSTEQTYSQLNWDHARSTLGALARASGGRAFSPESPLDLTGIYDQIMAGLRTRYVIQYHSHSIAGADGPRTVRIALRDLPPVTSARNGLPHRKGAPERLIAVANYTPLDVHDSASR